MKRRLSTEFVYQLFALLVAIIVVHAFYVGVVRPQADADAARQEAILEATGEAPTDRSLWIVIRNYEQELCFILTLWALALLGFKGVWVNRERGALGDELVPVGAGESILPEDAREYARSIEAVEAPRREFLYPRALLTALHRFRSTRNIQDVADAVRDVCEAENDRMDAELAMVRYIAWAIPAIGFIGTVRGIGIALSLAYEAVEGDISGVTAALGLAFNSTLVALVLSIIVMFCLYQLQLVQERLVLDTQTACDRGLIQNLQSG